MMPYSGVRFRSASVEWSTPDSIFKPLDAEFGFTLDVAASAGNAKCPAFLSREMDALSARWDGVCWMNPPYGPDLKKWVRKAWESSREGAVVVCLLPARTNTGYWHDYCMRGEVRFIRGYPKFGNAKQGLKVPLAIVVFRPSKAEVKA